MPNTAKWSSCNPLPAAGSACSYFPSPAPVCPAVPCPKPFLGLAPTGSRNFAPEHGCPPRPSHALPCGDDSGVLQDTNRAERPARFQEVLQLCLALSCPPLLCLPAAALPYPALPNPAPSSHIELQDPVWGGLLCFPK